MNGAETPITMDCSLDVLGPLRWALLAHGIMIRNAASHPSEEPHPELASLIDSAFAMLKSIDNTKALSEAERLVEHA